MLGAGRLTLLFPSEELVTPFLVLSSAGLRDGMMLAKLSGSSFTFYVVIFRFFCLNVLLKFLKWTSELSQSCFYLWIVV